jgi:WD40 repeat protein
MATGKASADSSRGIMYTNFHPLDNNILCVSGDYTLRFFRLSENVLKQISVNMMKRELQMFTCHTFMNEEVLLVGSDNGEVFLFEFTGSYELMACVQVSDSGSRIETIAAYTKGFIVGCEGGLVNVFERSEESNEFYKCTKIFRTPLSCTPGALIVSPSEDLLLCASKTNQLLVLSLSNSDIVKAEDMSFDHLSCSFHSNGKEGKATITGINSCKQQYLPF